MSVVASWGQSNRVPGSPLLAPVNNCASQPVTASSRHVSWCLLLLWLFTSPTAAWCPAFRPGLHTDHLDRVCPPLTLSAAHPSSLRKCALYLSKHSSLQKLGTPALCPTAPLPSNENRHITYPPSVGAYLSHPISYLGCSCHCTHMFLPSTLPLQSLQMHTAHKHIILLCSNLMLFTPEDSDAPCCTPDG